MAYHHGQLREALIDAAVGLARAEGPDAVVLRAVSRSTGVSHNAAYRHFEDRDDLLRAVCARCMRRLALLIEERLTALDGIDDAAEKARVRLATTGRAYVDFAVAEPGWFRTAFAVPRALDFDLAGGVGSSGLNPYEQLGAALDDLVTAGVMPPERRPGAEYPAWSAVHGLSMLLVEGPLRDLPAVERAAALDKVLSVVLDGL